MPHANVHCLQLNFRISKLVYFFLPKTCIDIKNYFRAVYIGRSLYCDNVTFMWYFTKYFVLRLSSKLLEISLATWLTKLCITNFEILLAERGCFLIQVSDHTVHFPTITWKVTVETSIEMVDVTRRKAICTKCAAHSLLMSWTGDYLEEAQWWSEDFMSSALFDPHFLVLALIINHSNSKKEKFGNLFILIHTISPILER